MDRVTFLDDGIILIVTHSGGEVRVDLKLLPSLSTRQYPHEAIVRIEGEKYTMTPQTVDDVIATWNFHHKLRVM